MGGMPTRWRTQRGDVWREGEMDARGVSLGEGHADMHGLMGMEGRGRD